MPAPDTPAERRGKRLHNLLFWAGVGVAPLAALLLLLGQSEKSLRVAGVLVVLAVVLIGLSIALRSDVDTVRLNMEEIVLDEIDMLREDLRNDIATAARATHKAFGVKLQAVHESVETLRGQVEAGRGEAGRTGYARPVPAGERSGYDASESVAAGRSGPTGHSGEPTRGAAVHGAAVHPGIGPGHPGVVADPRQYESAYPSWQAAGRVAMPPAGAAGLPRPHVSGALVRHTETVQVTTRHTIVDRQGEGPPPGSVYGGDGYDTHGASPALGQGLERGGERSTPARGRRSAEPDEESWGDQRLHEQGGGDGRLPRAYDRGDDDPSVDDRWSSMRSGDRWASVRSDERGRELRMGERRAAVHADESGTELRIEDRWTAVRREEPRRDEGWRNEGRPDDFHRDERRADDRWADGSGWQESASYSRNHDSREDDRWVRRGAPALPAAGDAGSGSWSQGWAEPEPEPVRRGRRNRDDDEGYGYLREEDPPRAGRFRPPDFELSDDRWR